MVISAVSGMGGVGKTELAIKYAHQHEAHYPGGVCWLSARESNLATKIVQFVQLYTKLEVQQQNFQGKQLSLTEQVRWCWQNWHPPEGLVLIVLDDLTNLESCRELLPTNNRFRVLITTRKRNIDPAYIQEISLDVFSSEEALQLLTVLIGENRIQRELQMAFDLCERLGYLPLGLQLVGRYLAEDPDLSLVKMWQRLESKRLEDKALLGLQPTLNLSQLGVKAAFELSWQELDQTTQLLGGLLSLFALDLIPWRLVESVCKLLSWVEEDVNEAKKQLYKRHLIQRIEDTDGCYKIHPLIREFLKVKLAESQQADNFKQAFVTTFVAIAKEIPDLPTQDLIELVKDAIPHLAEIAQNFTDTVSDENLNKAFVGLGRFYSGQGLYALAEPWYKKHVLVVKTRLGEEHPDVAQSFNNLAGLYYSQGRYAEAEPLLVKSLELRQRLLGEEHPDVAQSFNNLAGLYNSQGRYTEAESLYLKALELWQRLLGGDHPSVASSFKNLAGLYYSQGRYTEAEPLLVKALKIAEQSLGINHPYTTTIRQNLKFLHDNCQSGFVKLVLFVKHFFYNRSN